MKKTITQIILFLTIIVLTGCADVSHVNDCLESTEHTYSFFGGVWHGLIIQFSFVGSLFSDDIAIYAVNNNGWPYDFGFVGGLWTILKLIGYIFKIIND
jgi:hypothetical protein